jgi:RNA polymerase sigma-70 factor (ECF subfamily)
LYLEKEQEQALRDVAKKLSAQYRQVLNMRLEGLSFRQIGEALGRSENWARVTFFRAKNQLIAEMEGNT